MDCKERLEAYLREHGVAYNLQHHARAYTAQEVAAAEHLPGKLLAKVVMAYADGRLAMLAIPASRRVDLARLAEVFGAKDVRLAHEIEFAACFPDCEVGAMPPFGNLYQVPVYVDRELAEDETIVFQAGTHTDTMSIQYADFERLVQPEVADFRALSRYV